MPLTERLSVSALDTATGNDIVTMGWGLKYKPQDYMPQDHVEVGRVYELPLTTRKDLLESRLAADLLLRS